VVIVLLLRVSCGSQLVYKSFALLVMSSIITSIFTDQSTILSDSSLFKVIHILNQSVSLLSRHINTDNIFNLSSVVHIK